MKLVAEIEIIDCISDVITNSNEKMEGWDPLE